MPFSPTSLDIWIATRLAGFLGRSPFFDVAVQSAIAHNVLGGFWYSAAVFVLWVKSAGAGQEQTHRRLVSTMLGSLLAVGFTLLASRAISWPPPIRNPGFAAHFPNYMELVSNGNCFPSSSTALYTSVAAGIYSVHKGAGSILWLGVVFVVALPRMYVGGHYLTDVVAGLVLGLAGYVVARHFLESRLLPHLERLLQSHSWIHVVENIVIFVWIFQVAVEFRDAEWAKRSLLWMLSKGFTPPF